MTQMKRISMLISVLLVITACGGEVSRRVLSSEAETSATAAPSTPTPLPLQNIQVDRSGVLPPYGLTVKADAASLRVRISSAQEVETTVRLEALQQAIDHISAAAANDDSVALQSISVSQVSSSASSRDISSASALIGWDDTSSVLLALRTELAPDQPNLLDSLVVFDNFLKSLELPETIGIEPVLIRTEISNPEIYREQLIAKVYQELEAIQAEYGPSVKFEVTGLHSPLQSIPLSDTDYYLYLDPAIGVNEF